MCSPAIMVSVGFRTPIEIRVFYADERMRGGLLVFCEKNRLR